MRFTHVQVSPALSGPIGTCAQAMWREHQPTAFLNRHLQPLAGAENGVLREVVEPEQTYNRRSPRLNSSEHDVVGTGSYTNPREDGP